jgi:hypothetical protein
LVVDRDSLLDVVLASPDAVARHDERAWRQLFASRHVIEDPVGARPVIGGMYDRRTGQRGDRALRRFWDAFIAPNDVRFLGERGIVCGSHVVRDVTIETRLPQGVMVRTPAYVLYELTEEAGQPRISRLAAHWEVPGSIRQLMGPSAASLRAVGAQNVRILQRQGLRTWLAFGLALHSTGKAGKTAVEALIDRAGGGDAAARALLGGRVPTRLDGLIAAGDTVSARCQVDGAPAILLCNLNRRTLTVTRCALYSEATAG